VPPSIEVVVDGSLHPHPALCGDVSCSAFGGDEVDDGAAVIAAVGDYDRGARQACEQLGKGGLVRRLTGGDQQPHRQPVLIDDGVDLRAQSATRTANGVTRAPFFPPAACWWARTMELSINCSDCGDRSARASNILSQTPFFAHRLKRL